ncbi:MAG: GntR family transcriptional regulator [Burkholderiales bacterium]|nr:GntR family transcriptional regulator [Burkholderiales bacterium]
MNNPAPTFSPLYRQIKGLIMQSLVSGEWRPGEVIPSEMELAVRYKVSQGTVRKAIDELSAEKHLLRRQGKGTFVATHDEARAQFRFLRLMPDVGEQEWPASLLLDCKRGRASAEVARLLELSAGDGVVIIRRVLSFGDEPTVFEQIYLPGTTFKNLSAEIFNEYKGSMYKLFETEFGTRMIRAEEKIRAMAADPNAAELLRVPMGAPLLCVERVAFSYGEKPVEFRRGFYRTDKHFYSNSLG